MDVKYIHTYAKQQVSTLASIWWIMHRVLWSRVDLKPPRLKKRAIQVGVIELICFVQKML
ncbi:hypothetical protein KXD40_003175 [Peronospora effusa]|uniref:Uncharacterized protein n=1 Tax=Peronospora effusa TaxID=542832 RepID=A0A3M6VGZ2_9STRA|nr:hypothetical protein DD238_004558 [Peronospora effusa]RQM14160.1 hypothetical protein DD237_004837 [Peronospora effusa]UIZ29586.1 hypothetical protein KXD40_003175 [Peronospora effusa]